MVSKKNQREETKRSFTTGNSRQDTLCPDAVLPKAASINCVQAATSIIQKEVWFCDWDNFAEHRKLLSIIIIQCSPPSGSKVVCFHPRLSDLNELIQQFWRKTEQNTTRSLTWFPACFYSTFQVQGNHSSRQNPILGWYFQRCWFMYRQATSFNIVQSIKPNSHLPK